MISFKQASYALIQVAGATVIGFVFGAKTAVTPQTSLNGGIFFASILGGSLALYYASRCIGAVYNMKQWKAQYLTGAFIALNSTVIMTVSVVSGFFNTGMLVSIGLITMLSSLCLSLITASRQKRKDPFKRIEQPLPQTIKDFPFLKSSPFSSELQEKINNVKEKGAKLIPWKLRADHVIRLAPHLRTLALEKIQKEVSSLQFNWTKAYIDYALNPTQAHRSALDQQYKTIITLKEIS